MEEKYQILHDKYESLFNLIKNSNIPIKICNICDIITNYDGVFHCDCCE